jgi:hypothetical protein
VGVLELQNHRIDLHIGIVFQKVKRQKFDKLFMMICMVGQMTEDRYPTLKEACHDLSQWTDDDWEPTRKVKMKEKNKYLKDKELYVHVLLDRSGSMETSRDRTIDAFNEYIGSLDGETRVSLSLFDSSGYIGKISLDEVIKNEKIKDVAKLNRETFVPRGGTPLYDAIGMTVAKMEDRKENTVFVIITDGQENTSQEYTDKEIKRLLERKTKDGWLITYLGANQDAFAESSKIGIKRGSTMSMNMLNVGNATKGLARSTVAYSNALASGQDIGAAIMDSYYTEDERKAAVGIETVI